MFISFVSVLLCADYGNAYSFPQQWSAYTKAVHRALKADSLLSGSSGGSRSDRYPQQTPRYDGTVHVSFFVCVLTCAT